MGSSLRTAVLLGALSLAGTSRADDVYRYPSEGGRTLFTNAGRAQPGSTATPMELPALSSLDFGSATSEQLQSLDRGVTRAHEALQSSERCTAIRAASRVPLRTHLLQAHLREVAVTCVLCAVALLALVAWGGRLRRLMPLPPLLAAGYLGYATYTRVDTRRVALHEGLRACSSDLPEGHATSASAVKQRLESALSLQGMVDRAYRERAAQAAQYMGER
jgi:hypothetical protein